MGDPRLLLYPTDSDGNICGVGDKADKPYLFFFDFLDCAKVGMAILSTGCPTPQVCVSACPTGYWQWYTLYAQELGTGSQSSSGRAKMICKNNLDAATSSETVKALVESDTCAAYYMDSSSVVGRCIPSASSGVLNANDCRIQHSTSFLLHRYLGYLLNAQSYGEQILADVRSSWWLILSFIVLGTLVTFIWIALMRWLAGIIVWFTIFAFVGLFGFATYYTFNKWLTMKDNPDNQGTITFSTSLDYYTNLADTWLALGIISAVFLGIMLLILLFLRKRIKIAIALIKEASRGTSSMIFTLFWPLVPFLLQIIVLTYWAASAIYLASVGNKTYGQSNVTYVNETVNGVVKTQKYITEVISSIPCSPDNTTAGDICSFVKYGGEYTLYLQIFQLFMWLWVMNFIVALSQMVLAGAFASYYWAFKKPQDLPLFPVSASVWRSFRYHTGSLAFGALIIAIIQMIRIGLEYLDRKLKGYDNAFVKFVMACLKCCFWCLEKFMKFINKNAYIMIAVYGKNFCTSALNAFQLIIRNIVRVAVVDKISDIIIFFGKLVVTAAVTVLAFYFFSGELASAIPTSSISDYVTNYTPELNFYLVPVIIIGIATFVIASAFFSVFSMGVDTLFLCFLEDLERNDGSPEKPYYMNKELMNILGKKNRKPGEKKKGCCGR
ncbi:hypothetical protein CAPTEDRAFT_153937 [Capitella teleta]|uniref:Choline transporter-like protein n=1 Tax=Capitella teleta TaxID=283909 RepID=R7U0L1_CAPTE|nr:hypothetical protein CAPTEDRAFT_153937 [Capitella teleta]|eukprot:ELT97196.1 hypothetical protein CAPTEDRAFT_153937 [Capitella teleta]